MSLKAQGMTEFVVGHCLEKMFLGFFSKNIRKYSISPETVVCTLCAHLFCRAIL